MAPDKIYMPNNIDFVSAAILSKNKESDDIEYIRKDALLEWAKGEIMPGNSAEGKGWNMAIQTLIDKIESL